MLSLGEELFHANQYFNFMSHTCEPMERLLKITTGCIKPWEYMLWGKLSDISPYSSLVSIMKPFYRRDYPGI